MWFKYYTKLELTLEKLYINAKLIVGTNYGLRYFLKTIRPSRAEWIYTQKISRSNNLKLKVKSKIPI